MTTEEINYSSGDDSDTNINESDSEGENDIQPIHASIRKRKLQHNKHEEKTSQQQETTGYIPIFKKPINYFREKIQPSTKEVATPIPTINYTPRYTPLTGKGKPHGRQYVNIQDYLDHLNRKEEIELQVIKDETTREKVKQQYKEYKDVLETSMIKKDTYFRAKYEKDDTEKYTENRRLQNKDLSSSEESIDEFVRPKGYKPIADSSSEETLYESQPRKPTIKSRIQKVFKTGPQHEYMRLRNLLDPGTIPKRTMASLAVDAEPSTTTVHDLRPITRRTWTGRLPKTSSISRAYNAAINYHRHRTPIRTSYETWDKNMMSHIQKGAIHNFATQMNDSIEGYIDAYRQWKTWNDIWPDVNTIKGGNAYINYRDFSTARHYSPEQGKEFAMTPDKYKLLWLLENDTPMWKNYITDEEITLYQNLRDREDTREHNRNNPVDPAKEGKFIGLQNIEDHEDKDNVKHIQDVLKHGEEGKPITHAQLAVAANQNV